MLDAYLETALFALFAVVIGLVVFGGTTLAYFLDKRRPELRNHATVQRLDQRSKTTWARGNLETSRDNAA